MSPQFNKGTLFEEGVDAQARRSRTMSDGLSSCRDFCLRESILLNSKRKGQFTVLHACVDNRAYSQYELYDKDILKNAFLQSMYDQNQVFLTY